MKKIKMENNLHELKLKILLIGNSDVGKTSMILKYVDNNFSEEHLSTIGIEKKYKEIVKGNYKIILDIYDTAGQERYKVINKSFFNGANGIIFVYDITNFKSFEGIRNWMKETELYTNFRSILCGNKIDLDSERKVKYNELKEYGIKKKIDLFEVSAKTGENIDKIFDKIVSLILEDKTEKEIIEEFGVLQGKNFILTSLSKEKTGKNNCCKK